MRPDLVDLFERLRFKGSPAEPQYDEAVGPLVGEHGGPTGRKQRIAWEQYEEPEDDEPP